MEKKLVKTEITLTDENFLNLQHYNYFSNSGICQIIYDEYFNTYSKNYEHLELILKELKENINNIKYEEQIKEKTGDSNNEKIYFKDQ